MPAPDLHQHDLTADAARLVIAESHVRAGQRVCEFGAGTGGLTRALLDVGCNVLAVEIDRTRIAALHERFAPELRARRLAIARADMLAFAPDLTQPWRVISNPPFSSTAELVRRLLLEPFPQGSPVAIDLVLQHQAARKWSGRQDNQTRSSCLARCLGKARVGIDLPRDCTAPPSHVPLALWHWRAGRDTPEPALRQALDRLLTMAFAGPHTVRDALRKVTTPAILRRQAAANGWHPDDHPRTLKPRAWLALTTFLLSIGKL